MIAGVRSVGIFVGDQDLAKEFWTQMMGFELIQDTPMGQGEGAARWIELAPPERNVILVLFTRKDSRIESARSPTFCSTATIFSRPTRS